MLNALSIFTNGDFQWKNMCPQTYYDYATIDYITHYNLHSFYILIILMIIIDIKKGNSKVIYCLK